MTYSVYDTTPLVLAVSVNISFTESVEVNMTWSSAVIGPYQTLTETSAGASQLKNGPKDVGTTPQGTSCSLWSIQFSFFVTSRLFWRYIFCSSNYENSWKISLFFCTGDKFNIFNSILLSLCRDDLDLRDSKPVVSSPKNLWTRFSVSRSLWESGHLFLISNSFRAL